MRVQSSHFPAGFWHRLEDGRLQCDLCPRLCKLKEGQAGLCFVRAREGERLVLNTYGRSSGFCVDPIEKNPLNHFLPGTPVLNVRCTPAVRDEIVEHFRSLGGPDGEDDFMTIPVVDGLVALSGGFATYEAD